MLEIQLAFIMVLLILLTVLVANIYSTVRALKRDLNELMQNGSRKSAARQPPPPSAQAPWQPDSHAKPNAMPKASAASVRTAQQAQTTVMPNAGPVPPAMSTMPSQRTPSQPVLEQPSHTPQAPPQQERPRTRTSFENLFGTRVLGVLAALLIFAGLIFLGVLVAPMLTNEIRCASLFGLSAALTIAGLATSTRNRSSFSQALLGCGLGSVFVSLLLTYLYFGYLTDTLASTLLLAWLVACVLLSIRQRSIVLSVVAQAGMAISTCFAYSRGIELVQLPLLVGYQLAACLIVVLGCLKSQSRARLSAAFISMAVCILVSLQISWSHGHRLSTSVWPTYICAMVTQLAVASILSLFISMVCGRSKDGQRPTNADYAAHATSSVLWLASLGLDVYLPLLRMGNESLIGLDISIVTLITCAFVMVRWAFSLVLNKARMLDARLSVASVSLCAISCVVLLLIRQVESLPGGTIPLVVLVAMALWLSGAVLREPRLQMGAGVSLALDAMLMICGGYGFLNSLAPAALAIAYLLLLDCLAFLWWHALPQEKRARMSIGVLLVCIIGTEISLWPVWATCGAPAPLCGLAAHASAMLVVGGIACAGLSGRLCLSHPTYVALRFNEFALVCFTCVAIVSRGPQYYANVFSFAPILAVATSLLACLTIVVRFVHIARNSQGCERFEQVLGGIMFVLWSTCVAQGLLGRDGGAVVSVVAMLAALACVGLGFARRLETLRPFGLAVILLSVLKIVAVDVRATDSVARVIAFIVGGIICFAVSALYTAAVRRIDKDA